MKISIIILLLISANTVFSQSNKVIGTNIGDYAPEISLTNKDGKIVKLSSLKGQLVLIDFWAGWCRPCRVENKSLVKTYKRYKDESFTNGNGFTVYGVSLDKTEKMWASAIEVDGLNWTNVSSLKYWSCSAAKEYGVRAIPTNFLIDKDGKIIAKKLKGKALSEELNKYVIKDPLDTFEYKLEELKISLKHIKSNEKYSKNSAELIRLENLLNDIENIIEDL